MRKLIAGIIVCLTVIGMNAQEVKYQIPLTVRAANVTFTFQKVKSSKSSYYINYKAENTGSGTLVIDRSKASLIQNGGESHPFKEKYMIKSGDSKTIYNEFKVRAPMVGYGDQLDLKLYGIQYGVSTGASLSADPLKLGEGITQTVGDFSIKLMEYKEYSDRIYANVKCTYNGGIDRLGKIDLTKVNVTGGDAEIVKKGDVLESGKSYSFSINITPGTAPYSLNWGSAFEVLNLVDVTIDNINIKSTTFKEKPAETEANAAVSATTTTPTTATTEACALSYNDFSALKGDITSEVNSGGKPVEMANEFLSVKGCLNSAQVVELMGAFTLDAPRLEFAKMAYKYTSDKNKFHLAVQKLSYNKNKEALEEFLGQQ